MSSLDNDALSEALQCPVCFDKFTGRILLCNAGHQICEVCRKKVSECPQCRSKYTGTRNYMMEEVIALMYNQKRVPKKPKKNIKIPVISVYKMETLNRQKISPPPPQTKGLVKCEMLGCSNKLPISRLLNHVRYFHKFFLYEIRLDRTLFQHKFDIPLRNYRQAFQIAEFGLFFLIVTVQKNEGVRTISAWLQGTCSNRQARKYLYSLKFRIDDQEAQYSDLAYGKNQTIEYVQQQETCLKFKTTSRNGIIAIDLQVRNNFLIPLNTAREKETIVKKISVDANSAATSVPGRQKKKKKGKKNNRRFR